MPSSTLESRPGLAMIVNVMTPYRLNLHKLIAAGIPELKLHTLVTHGPADFDWTVNLPESIHATYWGAADDSPLASSFRRPLREWQKGGRMIRYLHENNARAVIIFGYRYISYLRIIWHCNRAGVPLFVNSDGNIHGDRRMRPAKRWFKRQVYGWWLRRASGVMSMGELGDQFFLAYGAERRSLYRVPYTPDYNAFAEVDADRLARFRRKFGLDDRHKYLMYSGRLVSQKRVDLLIDAFVLLAAERPDWDLLIVGDGPLGDKLRQLIPENLRPRVVWSGFLEQQELNLAYHAADVLVLPSDREPWAVVVQEALAAGLAVVASDVVGAAQELVADGVAGRVFAAGNADALRKATLAVTHPEQIDRFKQRSREALQAWRDRLDPVAEIRRALTDVGVLST